MSFIINFCTLYGICSILCDQDSDGKGLMQSGQDLRRTLAQLSTKGGFSNVRGAPTVNINSMKVEEESDEPEIEGQCPWVTRFYLSDVPQEKMVDVLNRKRVFRHLQTM